MSYKYYVYLYIRPDKEEVIYIGKGTGCRATSHFYRKQNPYLTNIIELLKQNNQKPEVKKVFFTNDEQEALNLERHLIKFYGRADLGLGTLCNFTDGGEVAVASPTGRKRQSEKMKLLPRTPEWNLAISNGHKGKRGGLNNNLARPIMISYRIYPTVKSAAKAMNLSESTLADRLKDFKQNGFPEGCKYLSKEEYLFLLANGHDNKEIDLPFINLKKTRSDKGGSNKNHKFAMPVIYNNRLYTTVAEAARMNNTSSWTIKKYGKLISKNEYKELTIE